MEQSELLAYLRSQRLGVLGTLAPSGDPQGALVGYAVTPDLELLFEIEIPDEDAEKITTVQQAIEYINERRNKA